jgi:hypothetical protein
MRGQKGLGLPGRRIGKAVHIMMTVALGMGHANQGSEG